MLNFRKHHSLLKILNNVLVDLPSPVNISYYWNFGSLLGVTLALQIVTGLLLASRYTSGYSSFDSVVYIFQDVNNGWLLRLLHSTIASFFFLFVYFHMGRGLYYGSYNLIEVWNLGVVIFFIIIITAFIGYVLPWGQMSYWAATVITNLISAIPYLGVSIVEWVWGGYSVSTPTLVRFYMLHFLLPFVLLFLVVLHIFFLHHTGSNNPVGVSSESFNVSFHYYYSVNDLLGLVLYFFILLTVTFLFGYSLIDAENFIPANPLSTPTHIQPEWYFLFAYSILRSIPNNLGGVVAMLMSILALLLFPFVSNISYVNNVSFSILARLVFWLFVSNFLLLTYLGAAPAQFPFTVTSMFSTFLYFSLLGFIIL